MAHVIAVRTIVTPKNFTVATEGDKGRAVSGVMPHDPRNHGRILVYFSRRKHGYWCHPQDIRFNTTSFGGKLSSSEFKKRVAAYIAIPPEVPVTPTLPTNKSEYKYHFGYNLKLVRSTRELSQAQLGHKMQDCGLLVAQSTICYRERSPYCPGGKFVDAAAKALNVPSFVFFLPLERCDSYGHATRFMRGLSSSMCDDRTDVFTFCKGKENSNG